MRAFNCPNCGKESQLFNDPDGPEVACPHCTEKVALPKLMKAPPPSPPAPSQATMSDVRKATATEALARCMSFVVVILFVVAAVVIAREAKTLLDAILFVCGGVMLALLLSAASIGLGYLRRIIMLLEKKDAK